ncbi:hypothetical protein MNB_SV-13-2005 [hydrothermal vent metagenome]|uniref:Glycoside-hydrolase family GH114 TIM-barrel domain-containing protein n=1 Tax=hydrothermal vent metagenome TaxID=652676 RepID=A0A1W1CB38_9ZZZZ
MILLYIPVLIASLSVNNLDLSQTPVYNQAYQENYDADTMNVLLNEARGAYVLLDPFYDNVIEYIPKLKSYRNHIGGYISVGTGENWRDDFGELEPYLTKKVWGEWAGEYYVSQTTGALAIMKHRINKMAIWGLDWVEFDNMDWLNTESKAEYGLEASEVESTAYINALCAYTHEKGMKCMAKNTVEGFEHFDGVLYESYHKEKNWWDTEGTKRFIKEEKPVIINHYNENNCDGVYAEYKTFYQTENILFICEDTNIQKYKHYHQ